MLRPSWRTRRAMRPELIIGFGAVRAGAPPDRTSVMTSGIACAHSLVREGWQRRDRRARRREAAVEAVLPAEAAVEVDRFALVINLGPGAAMRVVTENDAAAAGDIEPPIQPLR